MKQVFLLYACLFCIPRLTFSQYDSIAIDYQNSFDSLKEILAANRAKDFKRAVFLTENVFTGNKMDFKKFDDHIRELVLIMKAWMNNNSLKEYHYKDSTNLLSNLAIFKLMSDTIRFEDSNQKIYKLLPYKYDFTDFEGKGDWGYMFVTKLLSVKSGNCHSLPYLYKILADDLGASCWLSLAPNHIYIKNRCKQIGWYNTELTSGEFPIDAWITASGYIPIKAIQTGLYMDTLSNQQAIALCVLDLAKGYEFQTKNYYDGFILKCCDLVLQYHPVNGQAILLKAETLKRIYEKQLSQKDSEASNTFQQMETLYMKLFDLGYREMPEQMYIQWLQSVMEQRNKYSNKQIKEMLGDKKQSKLKAF